MSGNRTSRSLVYGMSLLRQFTAEQPVRGIAELADALNVSRPTAHRYASTCLELGYLEQAPLRRYRLARRATEPGHALLASLPLARRAQPVLRELRRNTGRTVSLAVLDRADVVYLQRLCGFAQGQYELEKGLGAGTRRPARGTAAGVALLASAGEDTGQRQGSEDGGPIVVDGGPIVVGGGPIVVDGGPGPATRGLAVAIQTPGERPYAIELTVPPDAITGAGASRELGDALRRTATALQRTRAGDRPHSCLAS